MRRWEVAITVFVVVESENEETAYDLVKDTLDSAHIGSEVQGILAVGVGEADIEVLADVHEAEAV